MSDDKRTATVLGGGQWGTALAHVLAEAGCRTMLWMRDVDRAAEINDGHTNERYLSGHAIHERVEAVTDIGLAASHARTIVVAIPSKSLRSVARELGDHVTGDQILISATKGLEVETLTRMSEILREETCVLKLGALSGPNLAIEIMDGQPAGTVVASRFEEVIEAAERMMAGRRLRIYGNFDIVGVELSGALKNVVAIAAGACTGLGFGANTLSTLMTRGMAEISRFGERLGAERATFVGLAGIGDLITTCTSPLSRNHTVGRRLAAGQNLTQIRDEMHMVAEGVNTAQALKRHADRLDVEMPIAEAVYGVLFEDRSIQDALDSLMLRRSRYENTYSAIHEPATVTGSILENVRLPDY